MTALARIPTLSILLLHSFVAGPAALAADSPTGEITRLQAVLLADAQHPELAAARLELAAADGRATQAAARPNPAFSAEAENFGGRNELRGFRGADYTAQLEQPLELGGKRSRRMNVAAAEKRLSGFDLAATRLDVRAETIRRFVAVQGAQERLALRQESRTMAEEVVTAVAARVRAGKVPPTDEDKARILLAQQGVALDGARRELEAKRVRLSAMWGSTAPGFDQVRGDLGALPDVPEPAVLAACLPGSPEVARWTAELEQRRAVLAQEQAAQIPDVTLSAGVRRFGSTDSHAFVAGVSVPLPIFDRNQGRLHEVARLLEKAEQQRRAADVEAMAALTAAQQAYAAARSRVGALRDEIIPRSKGVLDAVQAGYAQGKFTYLDLLDARRTFFDARAEQVEALVAGQVAWADLERAAGGTLPAPETN